MRTHLINKKDIIFRKIEKKSSELLQTIIFAVIASAQIFLVSRYYSREDWIGTSVF